MYLYQGAPVRCLSAEASDVWMDCQSGPTPVECLVKLMALNQTTVSETVGHHRCQLKDEYWLVD